MRLWSEDMRIALTGGGGYIGRHLVERLASTGHILRLLSRRPVAPAHPRIETAQFDLDAEIPDDALRGCDVLVHLAASIPADHDDPASAEYCWRLNAFGTLRLAEAAARSGVRHLVQTTSGNAYSPGKGAARREDDPLMPVSRGFYLGSKLLQEIYAREVCMRKGVALSTLRLSSVYGGIGALGLVASLIERFSSGEPVHLDNGGLFGADFVHVEDVAHAILLVISSGATGVFNVGSGERTTVLDLARSVARLCNAPEELIMIAPASADPDSGFAPLDCSRMRALGYRPRTLRDGLGQIVGSDDPKPPSPVRYPSP
ncbi:NAD-dependent epimerase/dehydratase family protein [Novosphingobium sp. M1R2S20]|uniref:NAD-dependent epimerase/dehydratase family protein n=1 Tax=Novosphingobium rhizovicinum TaxID=3228928 RepID=A0ABV3RGB1_9SPHN